MNWTGSFFISRSGSLKNMVLVGSFDAAEKALPHLRNPVDLLILDIDLPGMSGIEFRKISQKVPACIFVSSHPEYAIDTFEVDTFDFLTKPLKSERFRYSMQKLFDFFEMKEKSENFDMLVGETTIKIKEGSNISQIRISDILYLEALKDYTRIVTSEKRYCILDSIGSMLTKTISILLSGFTGAMQFRGTSSEAKVPMK